MPGTGGPNGQVRGLTPFVSLRDTHRMAQSGSEAGFHGSCEIGRAASAMALGLTPFPQATAARAGLGHVPGNPWPRLIHTRPLLPVSLVPRASAALEAEEPPESRDEVVQAGRGARKEPPRAPAAPRSALRSGRAPPGPARCLHPLGLDESRLAEYVQRDREPGEDVRVRVAHDLRDLPTASPSVEITCAFSSIAFHATCGSPPLPSPPRRAQSDCPPIRHTGPWVPTGRSSETTRRTATRPVIASASSRSKQRRAIPAEIP